ncbi:MAG: DNA polymerase III subunit gamma/tau [Oscillospiraceae bacterium]|nr:DNA polymerase III subunit gamma/tau [Oscillospiraceae bacterium]
MYQALYRKWRPKTFSDVIGQEHITSTLRRQVAEGRLSHAYLFTGTRGTGKTTCAKILSKAVNCENPVNGDPCNCCPSCLGIESGGFMDVVELDAASNNGVDHVRALRDEAIYSPAQVKYRVYIVDEVHMLSTAAFNALLKILEEPPEHLIFILATTELHKVPATILSRCQRFSFRRILARDIVSRIESVAAQEGIDLQHDGAEMLARLADGALRDALSLLDQCAAMGGKVDSDTVLETLGLAGNLQTAQLMGFVLRRDVKAALLLLHKLHGAGKDVGAVLSELSTLARDLLIEKTAPEGGAALLSGGYDEKTMKELSALTNGARLISMCSMLQSCIVDMALSASRRTDAELCLIKLCDEALSGDVAALNARIARLEEQLAAGVRFVQSESVPAAPVPAAAPAQELPWEEPPAPAEEEDRAPWDEILRDEPPQEEEIPTPAPVSAPAPAAADEALWDELLESYKAKLQPMKKAFIVKAKGRMENGVMVVYCPSEMEKKMLDTDDVERAIASVTGASLGREVAVRFTVGTLKSEKETDPMQELLKLGSKFDNFTVK